RPRASPVASCAEGGRRHRARESGCEIWTRPAFAARPPPRRRLPRPRLRERLSAARVTQAGPIDWRNADGAGLRRPIVPGLRTTARWSRHPALEALRHSLGSGVDEAWVVI